MTQFLTIEQKEQGIKTEFTMALTSQGWKNTELEVSDFKKIVYLGECKVDGHMFAAYKDNVIRIYKGIKGDEFNK